MKKHYIFSFKLFKTACAARSFQACFLILFFMPIIVNAQWIRKADEINKRAEGNNVIYRNKLYVFGGFGDNPVIESNNEVYDIASNTWKSLAPFPAGKEITHQGVVLVDDNVWHIGGRAVDGHGPVSSQVVIYNITTNSWSNGPDLIDPSTGVKFPIGGGGYGLVGRTIHVFGGFGPTICEDQSKLHLTLDVDKYQADPEHVTWENKSAPMPTPRNHLSYVVLGGKIYALGGQFKHDCLALDQKYCHVYDPVTNAWKRLSDIPVQRSHAEASTFAIDGKIYLVAGQGASNHTQNTTYQFSPKENSGAGAWTNLSTYKLPGYFLGLSSKVAGSSFIITNGALNSYSNERKETYIYKVRRSSSRTLGFSVSCKSQTLVSGNTSVVSNLLYCIEDTAPYVVTSNAGWIKVTKNATGTVNLNGTNVEISINTFGLKAGNYAGTVTATGLTTGSTASFCVNLKVTAAAQLNSIITNINSTSPGAYELSQLETGSIYYSDRAYIITSAPAFLLDEALIKTPNNDKRNSSSNVLSFNLTQDATVYTAYDPRGGTLPAWLQNWTLTSDKLGTNEPGTNSLTLYKKDFPAGNVTVGGNLQSPASGSESNYILLVKAKEAASNARTGLSEYFANEVKTNAVLYPNPANDHFRIEFKGKRSAISKIRIMQLNGLLRDIPESYILFSEQACDIQLAQLALKPGLHFVVIRYRDGKSETIPLMTR